MIIRSYALFASLLISTSAWCVLSVSITVYQGQAPCGQARGSMRAQPSGGTPPYTIAWSNGSTTNTISELPMGTYTVTVTDNDGTVAQTSADVTYMAGYPQETMPFTTTSCTSDAAYAIFPVNDAGGLSPTAPATFSGGGVLGQSLSTNGQWYLIEINDAPGQTIIYFTDALGCGGSFLWNINEPVVLPAITISGIGGSCSDGATGSATVYIPSAAGDNDLYFALKNASGGIIYASPFLGEQPGGFTGLNIPFSELAPGDYWAVLDVDEYCLFGVLPGFIASCADSVMFTIPALSVTCGTVVGTSWYDVDGDCVFDPEDVGVPYSLLLVEPGSNAVLTDVDGTYQYELVDGSYTLAQTDPTLIPFCPVGQPVPFTVNNDETTIDFSNGSSMPLDLSVSIASGQSRPGSNVNVSGWARNLSPQVSGAVTVSIMLDPTVDYLSATPTPSNIVGNTLTWDFPAFNSFHGESMNVLANVPVGVPLGMTLTHTITISNTGTEPYLVNNTTNVLSTVVGSFDPNDKTALTSSRSNNTNYFIDLDDHIDYTIRFQNTGTAEAVFVIVTDTLSENLDMLSFEQGVASHPFNVSFKPNRVVEWRFDNIDLPDSNTNEAASHGLVSFRIKPVLPLSPGTEIENIANIFFDYNDPVITDPSVLVAEFSTGVKENGHGSDMLLMPNPTKSVLEVQLKDRTAATGLLTVMALDGRVILVHRVQGFRTVLDVAPLASGLYTLNWRDQNGNSSTHRFVKE